MIDEAADRPYMARALELAARGQGHVEPNPMVGCVVVAAGKIVGEGWHARYGGPHAEPMALAAAGPAAAGATLYVTLEPCCHHGKTGPCTEAILQARIARVVIAQRDPFPLVAGGGIVRLQQAGVAVDVGSMESESRWLNAPYLKLLRTGRPWVIAKWAMTLDGKIATRSGDSCWISGEAARRRVHQLRGRMDAIVVGAGTARVDNPRLTVRPPDARTPTRVVVDSLAALPLDCDLVRTARQTPVLIAAGPAAPEDHRLRLRSAGCEVWSGRATDRDRRLLDLLEELGRRRMTNVLVEGGGQLLGSLFDAAAIDEVHGFVAAKLVGGAAAPSPLAGIGRQRMDRAVVLQRPQIELLDGDVYIHGRVTFEGC
jgi:diaminohydroxyphosphoribosylaminopyrimidine deaminase / 5-amino-6-(5-phosphoribosylamino)uracil reductase